MFVSKKRYQDLEQAYHRLQNVSAKLNSQAGRLLEINRTQTQEITQLRSQLLDAKQHINYLQGNRSTDAASKMLSKDDIKRLLMLCHPDKHANSTTATQMTVKLLAMRG